MTNESNSGPTGKMSLYVVGVSPEFDHYDSSELFPLFKISR